MIRGRTVEIYLVDGNVDGIMTLELSNWNGKAIKMPINMIRECNRKDIKGHCVYLLISKNDVVYIGDSENGYERLLEHLVDYQSGKDKYCWENVIMFIGRDLNKALIAYIRRKIEEEYRCYKKEGGLTNTIILKESEISSMNEFIENIKLLMVILGYSLLNVSMDKDDKEKADVKDEIDDKDNFYCKNNRGANAVSIINDKGVLVLKGSKMSIEIVPSLNKNYIKVRNRLIKDGIVDEKFIFKKDYLFKAPSGATSVLLGNNSNGLSDWKNKDGISLKEMNIKNNECNNK